jgi:glycosyltransferase involved in cell wall biosynthesis
VSIAIPTLNAVDCLTECIESARRNATRGHAHQHNHGQIVDG